MGNKLPYPSSLPQYLYIRYVFKKLITKEDMVMRVLRFEKCVCEEGLRGFPGYWIELWFVLLTL